MVKAQGNNQKNIRVNIQPTNYNTTVESTNNLSGYYAEISEEWAIGEGLVQGVDHSSKTYATQAKISADEAKDSLEQIKHYESGAVEQVQAVADSAIANISSIEEATSSVINSGLAEIGETTSGALESLETTSNEILVDINTSRLSSLTEITDLATQSKSELTTTKNNALSEVATSHQSALSDINVTKTTAITEINATAQPILSELDTVEVVVDNIDTVVEIGENIDNILNKTVTVGKTTTGEEGTSAKVVNSGTKYNPILDFTIPRGETGRDGGVYTEYDAETETLSMISKTGSALYPEWGYIQGELANQVDLNNALKTYVKNTDYATADKGGVIKQSTTYGFSVNTSTGIPFASTKGLSGYQNSDGNMFIGKNTLENIKDDYVKRGVTENSIELTADEKASAKQWLGYADNTDIMQAIASIPQFNLSIVNELPTTGAKMTLYLVPKEGTNNDVYDEYIWIEQTASFEHLGTTAVDLTDYVTKTDYATLNNAGLIRPTSYFGTNIDTQGSIHATAYTAEQLKDKSEYTFISKGTLENIKDDYVKRGLTENTIEFTADEKTSARTLIGAIGSEDYAGVTTGSAGIVKCSSTFACGCTNGYIQALNIPTLERYNNLSQYAFIGKATLQTALTEYSKTIAITQADYDALETKDENTLYLIEE